MTYFEPRRRKSAEDNRIEAILLAINENPRIHNNALKKIIVDEKKIMAKRTFDKLIQQIRRRGMVKIISMNDNKLHFELPHVPSKNKIDFAKEFEIPMKIFIDKIKDAKKKYSKFTVQAKQEVMLSILSNIFNAIVGITFMNSISDPSKDSLTKQEIRLRQMVKNCIDIIMYDKDSNLVFAVVNDSIINSFVTPQNFQNLKINQVI